MFLDELDPVDRADFVALARVRRFAARRSVFHAGDDAGSVMVVINGHLKVTVLTEEGREVVLAVSGPGDLLGEVGAIVGSERSATVTTLDAVEVLSVSATAFRSLLERRPRIALVLLGNLAARLWEADRQLVDFAAHDVFGRLARRLLDLAERAGVEHPGGVAIELSLTQDELAAWAGASREAVSKALSAMRELGWIQTGRRVIVLTDTKALRAHGGLR